MNAENILPNGLKGQIFLKIGRQWESGESSARLES